MLIPSEAATPRPEAEQSPREVAGQESQTQWHRAAPWILTASALFCLISIGIFLIVNINWFKTEAIFTRDSTSAIYHLQLYQIHLSFLKRSIGLFSGFSLLFIGLGVSFYTLNSTNTLKLESINYKSQLATASPGLVCVIVGAVVLTSAVSSQDTFSFKAPEGASENSQLQFQSELLRYQQRLLQDDSLRMTVLADSIPISTKENP